MLLAMAHALSSAEAQPVAGVALVVGVSESAVNQPAVLGALADASAMAKVLRERGFTVQHLVNPRRAELDQALRSITASQQLGGGVGLFYFSGHALRLGNDTLLVPKHAALSRATSDAWEECIPIGAVKGAFRAAGARMSILVLEAARPHAWGRHADSHGVSAPVLQPGDIVALSALPGQLQEPNRPEQLSLFTSAVTRTLRVPGVALEDALVRAGYEVRRRTSARQIPWVTVAGVDSLWLGTAGLSIRSDRVDAQHLRMPAGSRRAAWQAAVRRPTRDALYKFLDRNPRGHFAQLALQRLNAIEHPASDVLVDRGAWTPFVQRRLRPGDVFEFRSKSSKDGWRYTVEAANHASGAGPTVRVELLRDGQLTGPAGRLRYDATEGSLDGASTDLPEHEFPAEPLRVGQSWKWLLEHQVGKRRWLEVGVSRVVRQETISTEGGNFQAYVVEKRSRSEPRPGAKRSTARCLMWLVPTLPYPVVHDCSPDDPNSSFTLLTAYRPAEARR